MTHTTLVDAATLHAHLDDPQWIVFDCRHDLADTESGRRAYAQAHIPGARFLHLDQDLSGLKTGSNGRHPLPDPARLCARLAASGLSNNQQVIAYDDAGGCYAARLWWLLRWLGHRAVAVLDGGWQAWLKEGHATTAQAPETNAGHFRGAPAASTVDAAFLLTQLAQPQVQVMDARSSDRFRGENETLDPVGGHIPGAINRFFKNNLDSGGCFKPAVQLEQEFHELLGPRAADEVVHQCGSGVTACHNLLAMEIAGRPGSKLYPGSWSEWCSDPQRPVAR